VQRQRPLRVGDLAEEEPLLFEVDGGHFAVPVPSPHGVAVVELDQALRDDEEALAVRKSSTTPCV